MKFLLRVNFLLIFLDKNSQEKNEIFSSKKKLIKQELNFNKNNNNEKNNPDASNINLIQNSKNFDLLMNNYDKDIIGKLNIE